jgi:DNA repair exonuclease SbcCD ATPase subunit
VEYLKKYTVFKRRLKLLEKYYINGKKIKEKIPLLQSKISDSIQKASYAEQKLHEAEYNARSFESFEEKQKVLSKEYELLDILRKTWSPTTGIPLIFIEGFMNTLLKEANYYLGELWSEKDFEIASFNLDDKNFFINVKQHDSLNFCDASVCSGSERASLCTVLSLALLNRFPKASGIYNIAKFDEIDSTLDSETRKAFISILSSLLKGIHSEQSFIISHSDVFYSDVDVILLKNGSEYENRMLNGATVIYRRD